MSEKQAIINALAPIAVLKALTPQAIESIAFSSMNIDMISIRRFPFNVGRESRAELVKGRFEISERRKNENTTPSNDLYLIDHGPLLNISREHFFIDKSEDGYSIFDRGSACGTLINENILGGKDKGGTCQLKDGDIIAVGAKDTPYRFKFITLENV